MAGGGRRAGSGRKPTPTSLALVRGNPGHRRLKSPPPSPPSTAPPPEWLDERARGHWESYAPALRTMGLLTKTSEPAFAMLCESWSLYRRAVEAVQDDLTHTTGNGEIVRPEIGIRKGAGEFYRMLCGEFGMTPASLTRLSIGAHADRDEVADHQKAPRRSA